jgi:hypothetical protein
MKVFLSWSGTRAKMMAKALRDWLPQVLHAIGSDDPFFSEEDIDPGTFSDERLRARFADADYCIVCVTPENLLSPWINYEAGAIAERLGGRTVPWALGVDPSHMKSAPLVRLQVMQANQQGTRRVVEGINKNSPRPLTEKVWSKQFDRCWSELAEQLQKIPDPGQVARKATTEELAYEAVLIGRQIDRRLGRLEAIVPPELLKEPEHQLWREEYHRMMANIGARIGVSPAELMSERRKARKTAPRKKARKTTRGRA